MKAIADMGMGELAAYVCSHLQRKEIDVVLTGGGCVSIYAAGKYVSDDLDFIENISSGRRKLKAALAEIDFQEQGRYFRHPETKIFLEFPAGPLAVGDEPPQSLKVLSYDTGTLVALSPTDCVKDRLAAYFHWNDLECLEQALLVGRSNDIDLAEIERWSKKEGQPGKFVNFRDRLIHQ
ncbi:hypothetical protein [Trichloromonas acetexigens]|jgi:hypothetical protein|uniref:Nucleotidyltransferase family protein n=1 Tax=Trichloromonas acetexigens TaxID=38815 RepID=A0A550JFK5_9BACT|nr:hypothetical protein [Desulfuromonas acetexigens]TRO81985.1 hypothetical protein FL622_09320 [Desulfuromonas acetexigens]